MRRHIQNLSAAYAVSIFSFATTLCLAKWMMASDFGRLVYGVAVGTFCFTIINNGAAKTFVHTYEQQKTYQGKMLLIHSNLAQRFFLFFLTSSLVFIGTFYNFTNWYEQTSTILFIAWVSLRGLLPNEWYDAIDKTEVQNTINFFERLVTFILLTATIFLSSGPANGLLVATILITTRVITCILQHVIWWRLQNEALHFSLKQIWLRANSGTSIVVSIALIANCIAGYGSQILLKTYGQESELAAYGLAFQMMTIVLLFQSQSLRLLMRPISKACIQGHNLFYSLTRHMVLVGSGSLCLAGLTAVSFYLLPFILNQTAYQTVPRFIVPLCSWVILLGFGQVISQYIISLRMENYYLLNSLIGGIVATGLASWLIPNYGALGAGYVLLGTSTTTITLNCLRIFSQRHTFNQHQNATMINDSDLSRTA